MSPFFFFLIGLIVSQSAVAAITLPRNLTVPDQKRALEILGFGAAGKLLDNPYPLGGYSGVELGLAAEFVPIDELATLGDTTAEKGELSYYTLTLGKGLYYNIATKILSKRMFTPNRL